MPFATDSSKELEQVLRSLSKNDGQADTLKSTLDRKARELEQFLAR
jgi:lambda repressor-like predicted transcriptional regulator